MGGKDYCAVYGCNNDRAKKMLKSSIFCFLKRKKFFAGTVPVNYSLFAGTVPVNNVLFAGTVPVNYLLFTGTAL